MAIPTNKYTELSKTISHALRHEPWLHELELDDQGWVSVDELILSLSQSHSIYNDLDVNDLHEMINRSAKKRHEIKDGKIRALYGHSFPGRLIREEAVPPDELYHGTNPGIIDLIKKNGLLPMRRHYVHLSVDIVTAKEVGKRKSPDPIILTVRAKEAYLNKIKFYKGNEMVWLSEFIPSEHIEF